MLYIIAFCDSNGALVRVGCGGCSAQLDTIQSRGHFHETVRHAAYDTDTECQRSAQYISVSGVRLSARGLYHAALLVGLPR